MKRLKKLLSKPSNSIYLGLLVGVLLLATGLFPLMQSFAILLPFEFVKENSLCCYCILENYSLVFKIAFIVFLIYSCIRVYHHSEYKPLKQSQFMFIGYLISNVFLFMDITSAEEICSDDAFIIIAVWHSAPFASITPICFGIIYELIRKYKPKLISANTINDAANSNG